jgi:hypothetical protein
MSRLRNTHRLLRTLPDFLQDVVREHSAGTDEFNFVTIVEWDSAESMENARAAVMVER